MGRGLTRSCGNRVDGHQRKLEGALERTPRTAKIIGFTLGCQIIAKGLRFILSGWHLVKLPLEIYESGT